MNNKIIINSKNLYHYNLNFITDNFQINIHNFIVKTFEDFDGCITHQHSAYELHYIKNGTGSAYFNEVLYTLKSGDLFLIAPNTPHKQQVLENVVEYVLRFDIKKLNATTTNQTIEQESSQILDLLKSSSNQVFTDQHSFEKLFEKSYLEAYTKKPGYYITIKQYLMNIIIEVARLAYNKDIEEAPYHLPTKSIEFTQIEQISKFIRDNISSHITNTILSNHVHLSERQLHRIVKDKTGLSPHQFVSQIRMQYVKELIDSHLYTLKTISEMSGFSSEFHLSSAFKKCTGMTPTEYINNSKDIYIY